MKDIHKDKSEVPIEQKIALTKYEAAAYSNIGINKIDEMLRTPGCPFVLHVGQIRNLSNVRSLRSSSVQVL